jgi:hypothetical protein
VAGIPPKQEAKDEVIEFDPTFGECAPVRKKNCKKKKEKKKKENTSSLKMKQSQRKEKKKEGKNTASLE